MCLAAHTDGGQAHKGTRKRRSMVAILIGAFISLPVLATADVAKDHSYLLRSTVVLVLRSRPTSEQKGRPWHGEHDRYELVYMLK